MDAYVLVQTDGHPSPIARDIRTISGVCYAEDLRGPYSAIALARSTCGAKFLEHIIDAIRALPGVTRVIASPLLSPTLVEDGAAA